MDQRHLISALDDARTFTHLLEMRGAQLLYGGVAGVRQSTLLWHYLRARHYGRHSMARALRGAAAVRGARGQRTRALVDSASRDLTAILSREDSCAHVFRGEWAVGQIVEAIHLRDPVALVMELGRCAEGSPLGADLLDEDDLELVQTALSTRHDTRVVAWELGQIAGGDPATIRALGPEVRRADAPLTNLVKTSSALALASDELRSRFYTDDSRSQSDLDRAELMGETLGSEDFPWLDPSAGAQVPRPTASWWL